jgi:hypothetical protein
VTLALSEGGLAHTHAEMERAFQRQPEGPSKFQTPRHQQCSSPRPKPANNTIRVHQNDPLSQREQRLFGPHSEVDKIVARKRRDQITAVLRDTNAGACRTDDAELYVAEIIPHLAIACGQAGFEWALNEWVEVNTPLVSRAAVDVVVGCILQDPPRYNSAATGRRLGLTIEQYDRLGLTLIRPAGWSRQRLDDHIRSRKNKRVKAKRQASGETRTPRELSAARLKPWAMPGAPCRSKTAFYGMPEADQAALLARARAEAAARP